MHGTVWSVNNCRKLEQLQTWNFYPVPCIFPLVCTFKVGGIHHLVFLYSDKLILRVFSLFIQQTEIVYSRSQWPCGLRRGSTAARLLVLWVRIPPGAWMSVSCECCVLSGRGLCDEAGHSSRGVLPIVVCLSVIVKPRNMRRPRPPRGCRAIGRRINSVNCKQTIYFGNCLVCSKIWCWSLNVQMHKRKLSIKTTAHSFVSVPIISKNLTENKPFASFFLQRLFRTLFAWINIWLVAFRMREDKHACLLVKWLLKFSDLN
jgi:hypothetical protein